MDIIDRDSSKREEIEVIHPSEMRNNASLLAQVWQVLISLKFLPYTIHPLDPTQDVHVDNIIIYISILLCIIRGWFNGKEQSLYMIMGIRI